MANIFHRKAYSAPLALPNGNRVNASIGRNTHDEDSPVVPSLGLYSGGRVAHRSLPDWNTIRVWVCLEIVNPRSPSTPMASAPYTIQVPSSTGTSHAE